MKNWIFIALMFGAILVPTSVSYGMNQMATLILPKHNSSTSDTAITLSWNPYSGGVLYHLQVAPDNMFGSLLVDDSTLTVTGDTVSLSSGSAYYWRVRVDTGGGNFTNWSNTWSFSIYVPTDLAHLKLWLSGDSGVSYNGSNEVDTWMDRSLDSNDFVQATASNKPIFVDSALNDLPVLDFDGSNDYLQSAKIMDLTAGLSYFVVTKNDLRKNFNGLFRNATSPSTGSVLEIAWEVGSTNNASGKLTYVVNRDFPPKVSSVQNDVPPPVGTYYLLDYIVSDTSFRGDLSNVPLASVGDTGYVPRNASLSGFVGTGYQSTSYLNGKIAEVIIFDTALTDTSRQKMLDYLRYKYAPPVNLGQDINVAYGFCDTILDAGPGYTNYLWSTGNPADTNQTLTVNRTGMYAVTVTGLFGNLSMDSVYVTYPGLLSMANPTICIGDTFNWDTGLDTVGYDFLWSDLTTDSAISVSAEGTYYVAITDTIGAGCTTNSDTITLTADSFATIMTLGNDTAFCAGNSVALIQGDSLASTYLWTTGDTSSSIAILVDSTVGLTATSVNGCVGNDSIIVTINGTSPVAGFTSINNCFGENVQFTDTSSAPPGDTLVSWSWDFDDSNTSTAINPSHLYADTGQYTVNLTVTSNVGCDQTFNAPVTVVYYPNANFVYSSSPVTNIPVQFSDGTSTFGQPVTWLWDFGDANNDTAQNPAHAYAAPGSYTVKLIVTNASGCVDSSSQMVNVLLAPPLTGMRLWLRADVGVSYNGSNEVDTWIDQSLDSNDFVQGVTANKPIRTGNIINDLPIIDFDGGNDYLQSTKPMDLTVGLSYFVVAKNNVRKNFNGLFRNAGTLTTSSTFELSWETGSTNGASGNLTYVVNRNFPPQSSSVQGDAGPAVGNYYILDYVVSDTAFDANINGAILASISDTGYLPRNGTSSGYVGTGYQSNAFLNGEIAEVIIFDQALVDSARLQTIQYLRDKYAPAVDLGPDITIGYGFCDTVLDAHKRYLTYQWSTGNPADTNQTLTLNRTGTYFVTVTDVFGYTSIDSVNVVYPGTLSLTDPTICVGDTFNWGSGLDTVGYDFLWSDLTVDSSISITAEGAYYVTITDTIGAGCTTNSDTLTLTLDSFATIMSLGSDTAFCAGSSVGLVQGDSLAATYLWTTSDTISSIVIWADTTVGLNATSANGCVGNDSIMVTINGISPIVGFVSTGYCFGDAVQFTDTSSAPMGDTLVSWQWDFGDSSSDTNQNPTHVYADTGLYTVTLTVTTNVGCNQTFNSQVNIVYYPDADFDYSSSPLTNIPVQFNDTSTAYGQSISWQWDFGDSGTDTLQSPAHTYTSLGDYTVQLIVTNSSGCADTSTQILTALLPPPVSGMVLWLRSDLGVSYNGSNEVSLWQDQSTDGNNFMQGTSAAQPLFIDSVINNYPVLQFDGSSDYLQSINPVDLSLGLSYFIVTKNEVRKNFNGLFRNASTATTGSSLEITWEAGTSNSGSGNLTYVANRDFPPQATSVVGDAPPAVDNYYILDYIVSSSMIRSDLNDSNLVLLNDTGYLPEGGALPGFIGTGFQANSFLDGEIAEVIIYNTDISNSSRQQIVQYLRDKYAPPVDLGPDIYVGSGFCSTLLDANSRYLSYQWSTGSPADTNQTLTLSQPGTYGVTVTDIFGFTSSDVINVFYPGNLYAYNDTTICMNTSFTWDTQLDTAVYSFSWQDTSNGQSFTISQAGAYNVTVTDSNLCSFTSDTINVLIDSFEVTMKLDSTDTVCAGNSIGLVQGASIADTYSWCTSGGTSATESADSTRFYCVTVTDTNGCIASDNVFKYVQGVAPTANFVFDTTCFGGVTTFTDLSTIGGIDPITAWYWDFDDSNNSTMANTTNTYPDTGTYMVSLTVTTDSGCAALVVKPMIVYPLPQSAFSPLTGCTNTPVSMQDISTISSDSIINWIWTFDTVTVNSIQSPSYIYPDTGEYWVSLTTFSNFGCSNVITQIVDIKESPNPGFEYQLSCGATLVSFTDTTVINSSWISPSSYNWSFGDGNTSTSNPTSHVYGNVDTFDVTLSIQAVNGCAAIITQTISVAPISVNADFTDLDLCIDEPHTFIDNSTASGDTVILWFWQMAPLGNLSNQNPLVTYTDSGAYTVSLQTTSAKGCVDSISKTVTVHGRPTVDFSFSPQFGVNLSELVQFNNLSVGCASYLWDFGDSTGVDTAINPTHQYTDTGVYQVTLHCLSGYNCPDSLSKWVDVRTASVDLEVIGLSADCQPGLVEDITITLVNRGTREITSADLFVRVEGRDPIREQWTGFLEPQEVETYTFAAAFPLNTAQAINYVCAWTENPNGVADEVPTNNEQCVACENNFALIDLFPNPATDQLNVWFVMPQAEDISAELYDERGAYIGEAFTGTGVKGLNQIVINTSELRYGVYALKIVYLGNSYVRTFVVH